MRKLEEMAFRAGVTAEVLMEEAGQKIADWILREMPRPGCCVAFIGKGNNGGDALVALRVLREAGWQIGVRAASPPVDCSVLSRKNARLLPAEAWWDRVPALAVRPLVLLDGLLGIGARGELQPPLDALALEMATLQHRLGGRVVAIDLPSGLDADSGEGGAVAADVTLTLGMPKSGLLDDRALDWVGRLCWLPLGDVPIIENSRGNVIVPWLLPGVLPRRSSSWHKGRAGRVAIWAGSSGMSGAAVLACWGALRGGAGLVTLMTSPDAIPLIAPKLPPEVMLRVVIGVEDALKNASDLKADALVVGPGLGGQDALSARGLVAWKRGMVIDADGLNRLAACGMEVWGKLSARTVLTPHPGEFARMAPHLSGFSRVASVRAFCERTEAAVLLKGGRTLISAQGAPLWFNPTGTPGMASGGQGDLLSGVIGAQLARGCPAVEAACLGAWVCGRAAEIAQAQDGASVESLTASDTCAALGRAFDAWRMG